MLSNLIQRLDRIPILPTSAGLSGTRAEHVSGLFAFSTQALERDTTVKSADPELVIPNLELNARYLFQIFVIFLCTSTAPDVAFRFQLPAGASGRFSGNGTGHLQSSDNSFALQHTLGSDENKAYPLAANQEMYIAGTGLFQTGNTVGSLEFFWAQNGASAVPVSREANAMLWIQRYA